MTKAVVFDCDGVLVDSEPHSWISWQKVVARYGGRLTDTQIAACTGLGYADTYHHVAAVSGACLPPPALLFPEILAALEESFTEGLYRFEDAIEAASKLASSGVRLGVASTSYRARLNLTLAAADVGRFFTVSVAGDEVAHPKPAPDVYLRAAELLGVEPGRCVAVEDSAPGVRAALAAGMRVVGVARRPEDIPVLAEAGAGVVPSVDAAGVELLLDL